jgi:hypothetical protein
MQFSVPAQPGSFSVVDWSSAGNSWNGNGAECAAFFSPASVPALIAYWKFDETSGTTAADSTGNGNTGTLQNGPVWTNGLINGALSLDGVNDFLSTTIGQSGPNTFTASLWFKTTTTSGGKLIGFGDQQTGSSAGYDRHLYMNNAGQIYFGCCPGGGGANVHAVNTTASYNDGAWHHAAGMVSSAGMLLYVDGVLCASNLAVTSAQAFTGYWKIGYDNLVGWPGAPTSYYFKGCLDDVRVYNRALSTAEVAALAGMTNSAPVAPTITAQPTNVTVTAGQTATFNVAANGAAPLWYQWRTNAVNIANATNATYTTPTTKMADNGKVFSVIVSNATGNVTSGNATLTVKPVAISQSAKNVGGGWGMDFMTVSSIPYSVMWRTNLLGGSWALYTNLTGNGNDAHVVFTNAVPQGFFEILVAP